MSSYPAIVMGLPVVAFDTGAETDLLPLVGHGIAVPNKDVSAAAAAVRRLLADPQLAGILAAKGAAYGRTQLDLRATTTAYSEFYRRLSAGAPGLSNG